MPEVPLGYTMPPTLQEALVRSGASSQLPRGVHVPGRGGAHGAHTAGQVASACILREASSASVSRLSALTGVLQPQGKLFGATAVHWPGCAGSHALAFLSRLA
jgi:hypothetical protein